MEQAYLAHARVRDLSQQGEGIMALDSEDPRYHGRVIFVPGTVPGDQVGIQAFEQQGKKLRAKEFTLLAASPDRQTPFCPHFGTCGGCQMQALSYSAGLRIKQKHVQDLMLRIAKFSPAEVESALKDFRGMDHPLGYRSIVQMRPDSAGRLAFYAPGGESLVPLDYCFIQTERFNQIRERMNAFLTTLAPTDRAAVRQVELRQNSRETAFLISVVLDRSVAAAWSDLGRALAEFLAPATMSLGLQLGEDWQAVWGDACLVSEEEGLAITYSPASFQQTNIRQTRVLYDLVSDLLGDVLAQRGPVSKKTFRILELYCGVGSLSLKIAQRFPEVRLLGVEIVPDAVRDARMNARNNGFSEAVVSFLTGDAAAVIKNALSHTSDPDYDLVLVDPPRQGLKASVAQSLNHSGVPFILYVSCHPASLARDLKILKEHYCLTSLQGCDMFPWTTDSEVVALLTARNETSKRVK